MTAAPTPVCGGTRRVELTSDGLDVVACPGCPDCAAPKLCETCGHDLESHTRCGCLVIGCQCGRADDDPRTAPKPAGEVKCGTCNGRGEVGGHRGQTPEQFEWVTEECPDCNGTGVEPKPAATAREPSTEDLLGLDRDELRSELLAARAEIADRVTEVGHLRGLYQEAQATIPAQADEIARLTSELRDMTERKDAAVEACALVAKARDEQCEAKLAQAARVMELERQLELAADRLTHAYSHPPVTL